MEIKNAYLAYNSIVCEEDLRKARLTLCEYETIGYVLSDLMSGIASETITQRVAEWFRHYKFKVQPKGIGWAISL